MARFRNLLVHGYAKVDDQRVYEFFELLHVGLIDPDHLGRRIDERLDGSGVDASGIGPLIVRWVGPRTQDIMRTARTLWFRAVSAGKARTADVASAVDEIVTAEDAALRRTWEDLSPVQQRVLRAVAAGVR